MGGKPVRPDLSLESQSLENALRLFSVLHESAAVYAPHIDMPQPNFVPGMFSTSLITQSRGLSAGTSTDTASNSQSACMAYTNPFLWLLL